MKTDVSPQRVLVVASLAWGFDMLFGSLLMGVLGLAFWGTRATAVLDLLVVLLLWVGSGRATSVTSCPDWLKTLRQLRWMMLAVALFLAAVKLWATLVIACR